MSTVSEEHVEQCSVDDFQHDSRFHLNRVKATGSALILTEGSEPAFALISISEYRALLDAAELLESMRIVDERSAAAAAGRPGIPAQQVFEEIARAIEAKSSR